MSKKLIAIFAIVFSGVLIFSSGAPVLRAAGLTEAFTTNLKTFAEDGAGYKAPTGSGEETIYTTIGLVINIALSLLGVIFLALIIYAGFEWMIARGDEAKVTKSKDIMKNAVIGLVIVLAAYVISYFVVYQLGSGLIKSSSVPQ